MFNIKVETEAVRRELGLTRQQSAKIIAVTITEVAYRIQNETRDVMRRVFDNPTKWILDSVRVKRAKVEGDNVTPAEIYIANDLRGTVQPSHSLFSEVSGGTRSNKRSESALHAIAPSGRPQLRPGAKAELDAHGNIAPGVVNQVISAMQLSTRDGFNANSRVRGVSGLTRSQADRLLEAKREDEFARSRRFKDESRQTRELVKIQARQRLNDFKKRLLGDESRFAEARARTKAWLLSTGKGPGKARAIIYAIDWTQRWSNRLRRMVFIKKLRPTLVFTKPQSYSPKLPFQDLARQITERDTRKIWEATAVRLVVKWKGK